MLERKMWDAYAEQAGGVTFDGKPLPTWDELGEDRQLCWKAAASVCEGEIERLRGALRTIDSLIPKTKEITDFPYWVAIAGDIAEGALNGTWPAYGVMPAPAKEKE